MLDGRRDYSRQIRTPLARCVRHDGGVATDLVWDDVRDLFDPNLMGSLPDACVPDTSVKDWQDLLDLVVARGRRFEYSEGDTVVPVPTAATVLARAPGPECPALRVWPYADMLMIFRFVAAEEIDFDLDLREIQGQERLDQFCGFLRAVGRHLGDESGHPAEHPALGFSIETDRVAVIGLSSGRSAAEVAFGSTRPNQRDRASR